jgi:hypothetical protein
LFLLVFRRRRLRFIDAITRLERVEERLIYCSINVDNPSGCAIDLGSIHPSTIWYTLRDVEKHLSCLTIPTGPDSRMDKWVDKSEMVKSLEPSRRLSSSSSSMGNNLNMVSNRTSSSRISSNLLELREEDIRSIHSIHSKQLLNTEPRSSSNSSNHHQEGVVGTLQDLVVLRGLRVLNNNSDNQERPCIRNPPRTTFNLRPNRVGRVSRPVAALACPLPSDRP